MTGPVRVLDDGMQAGLLMETAHAQQQLAQDVFDRLTTHVQGLDGVVRDEIRRTLLDELQALTAEVERTQHAFQEVRHAVDRRALLWNVGVAVALAVLPWSIARLTLPSPGDLDVLRRQRVELAENVSRLRQLGGAIDWRKCGEEARLCVRVDHAAPAYGTHADYYVVKER